MSDTSEDNEGADESIIMEAPHEKPQQRTTAMRRKYNRRSVLRTKKQRQVEDVAIPLVTTAPTGRATPTRDDGFNPDYDGPGVRASREGRDVGQFDLPHRLRANGWDGQWIAQTVYGEPLPNSQALATHHAGWRAAKAKDFPELVAKGTTPDAPVDIDGQRLFIRPMMLTQQARDEDYRSAQAQQEARMQATRNGEGVGNARGQGLADLPVGAIKTVPLKLEIEGEVGTYGPQR